MFKRKQLEDENEHLRRDLGLERDDFEGEDSSDSDSDSSSPQSDMDATSADEGAELQAEADSEDEATENHSSKIKVMVLGSRGINSRHRHLMNDLNLILPHSKRESKFDDKSALFQLNELAELNSCTHTLFLETRKPDDLYLWLAKCPSGPSVRFHVENIHTLDELSFAGNYMLGSRPFLSFDSSLSSSEHGKIIQELLSAVFGTPSNCRKTRPYFDHVFQFGIADGRVWFRNYQIVENGDESMLQVNGMSLVEVGPRFVLNPVRLFSGSFGGSTIWSNENFMSSAAIRAQDKRALIGKHLNRVISHENAAARKQRSQIERAEVDKVFDN